MKLSMAMLGVLFAAVAAAVEVETLNGSNLLGLVRIASEAEYLPIAVDCGAVGWGDAAPSADALVLTAGLAPGDSLYVYDRVNAQYRVFDLVRNEDGDEWRGRNVVHVSDGQAEEVAGAAAGDTPLAVGYGVWLHRPGAAKRENRTVLVVGQVLKSEVTVELAAAPAGKAFGQTLFGVPATAEGDFRLNGGAVDWKAAGAAAGDEIRVPQADGSLATIRFNGAKWTRRYYTIVNGIKRLQTDNNPALTAGTAAWYARKAGGGAMSVTWEAL